MNEEDLTEVWRVVDQLNQHTVITPSPASLPPKQTVCVPSCQTYISPVSGVCQRHQHMHRCDTDECFPTISSDGQYVCVFTGLCMDTVYTSSYAQDNGTLASLHMDVSDMSSASYTPDESSHFLNACTVVSSSPNSRIMVVRRRVPAEDVSDKPVHGQVSSVWQVGSMSASMITRSVIQNSVARFIGALQTGNFMLVGEAADPPVASPRKHAQKVNIQWTELQNECRRTFTAGLLPNYHMVSSRIAHLSRSTDLRPVSAETSTHAWAQIERELAEYVMYLWTYFDSSTLGNVKESIKNLIVVVFCYMYEGLVLGSRKDQSVVPVLTIRKCEPLSAVYPQKSLPSFISVRFHHGDRLIKSSLFVWFSK